MSLVPACGAILDFYFSLGFSLLAWRHIAMILLTELGIPLPSISFFSFT